MIKVTTFYKFFFIPETRLENIQSLLKKEGHHLNIRGLILIGTEGINATVSGLSDKLEQYKTIMQTLFPQEELFYKDSLSETWNFKRLSVKIKPEIVSVGKPEILLHKQDTPQKNDTLSPEKWDREIENKSQVLDVRNNYETALGKFQEAQELDLDQFNEFP
ncbi:MAG: hypothetical protein OXB86_06070, partial [Bdellovibrionales bacterium]|nr:hypothetical protein [Bdellovibrionales bacterium]